MQDGTLIIAIKFLALSGLAAYGKMRITKKQVKHSDAFSQICDKWVVLFPCPFTIILSHLDRGAGQRPVPR
jgi:hypothetical protein